MKFSFNDLLLPAGFLLLSYGCWLAWHPAGFMVGGAGLITAGILLERGAAAKRRSM